MSLLRRATSPPCTKNSKRVVRYFAIWGIVVQVLLSIDVSTATWSPHNPPNGNFNGSWNRNSAPQRESCSQNVHIHLHTLRGGSTILQPPPPPLQGEQQQQQEQNEDYQESSRALLQQQQEILYREQQQQQAMGSNEPTAAAPTAFLPKITLKQVTKALLHTTEWNRKLLNGVKHWGRNKRIQIMSSSQSSPAIEHHSNYQQQWLPHNNNDGNLYHNAVGNSNAMYGSLPVNVHPSRTWQPPIEASSGRSFEEEELTLFHAKIPRSKSTEGETVEDNSDSESEAEEDQYQEPHPQEEGAQSWGPDLLPYLKHITETLEIDLDSNNGIELVLAMVYLDRACSVDTPRSNGVPPCPFCQPRTVHRLGLAALVVAKKALSANQQNGAAEHDTDLLVIKLSLSLGIPKDQLQQMVEWMVAALGDTGLYVGLEEMRAWSRTWESFLSATNNKGSLE